MPHATEGGRLSARPCLPETVPCPPGSADPRDGSPPPRPQAQHKHGWGSLTGHGDGGTTSVIDLVHEEIFNELIDRNRRAGTWVRPLLCLYDGQEALWEARRRY